MLPEIPWATVRFGAPRHLWLLALPAVALVFWGWQAGRRWCAVRRLRARRHAPRPAGVPRLGALPFWLCLVLASASAALALAEPRAVVSAARTAGIDLVFLLDGSASMHVADVPGTRWTRATALVRTIAGMLSWREDRAALAVFARIAAPQVRLTSDPNTLLFFLDHLTRPPFPIEDDASWDTNIERGLSWGVRLIERDEELHGASPNAKAFVLVSDGQAWSGEVQRALDLAAARGIPVYVVGVGTTAGGVIPDPSRPAGTEAPIVSVLDRASLMEMAATGKGRYFEIGRESDREIAAAIVDGVRRRAASHDVEEATVDLHWWCLLAAAAWIGLGALFLRDQIEIWLLAASAAAAALFVARLPV